MKPNPIDLYIQKEISLEEMKRQIVERFKEGARDRTKKTLEIAEKIFKPES